jgi:flagellar motor switch/type III secretory pathway protein FliN/flagellar biogenesis protein FliO
MKRATSATIASNDMLASRDRSRSSADVNRWVEMIDAELRSESEAVEIAEDSVTVSLEFGRGTIDAAAQPLQVGDSLPLDQLADEPLDVVVDGRAIARGELVVVDGSLGVRIVELLMLVLAWFAIGTSEGLADERPRGRTAATVQDDEPEILETPFGSVRGTRAGREADVLPAIVTKFTDMPAVSSAPPLPRRSDAAARDASRAQGSAVGWSSTVWPLLFVVGLIVVGARWLKSRGPTATRGLSNDVFEVLGRKAIDPRTSVVLARCGSRLLVLSLSPHGLATLAEITDPVEIDCLAGLCRSAQREQTLVETFRSMLQKPASSKPVTSQLRMPAASSELDQQFATRILSRPATSPSIAEVRT